MHGIKVCALETFRQQHGRPMGALILEAGTQARRLLIGVRTEGMVLGSGDGSGKAMRNIHSGQTNAIDQSSWPNRE